jgi:cytochrome c biogenesis protein CcdA
MQDLLTVLVPILLADVVNPVLFAFMVYAVGTDRPLLNANAVLLGHTAAYLAFGIALAFAYDAITERLGNPAPLDFVISLVIGMLLLWFAWKTARGSGQENTAPEVARLTPLKAFATGAIVNAVGIPFALPYFAAIDQVLKADLSITHSVMVLAGYNLAYALPFLIIPGLVLALGDAGRPVLISINEKLDRISAFLMPILLGLVGGALVADSVHYFVVGEGLL